YGIRITPVGVLRPGHGYSLDCERKLFESDAIVVVPTAAHAIKDLLRADNLSRGNKKIPDYWKMKRIMSAHHGAIEYLMGQKNGKNGSK
ncbi:MAG: hypothetical protein GYA55_10660, partial [SAR324 cluster bacterium]|nr:hypothetical protein [SAR324 cluster bacterium]